MLSAACIAQADWGNGEGKVACVMGIAWLTEARGSPTEIRICCSEPALFLVITPHVSHCLDTDLLTNTSFSPTVSTCVSYPEPYISNTTRVSFLQDKEIQISPQDFTC